MTDNAEKIAEEAVLNATNMAKKTESALFNLLSRVTQDKGEAFKSEVIEALSNLKRTNRADFESMRSKLKEAGVRVSELDKALLEDSDNEIQENPSQADILVDLANNAALFHTPDGTAYTDFEVKNHRETWPVRSKGFKRWLTKLYYEKTGGAPNAEALNAAFNVIEAKAHYDAPELPVFIRVAGHDGKIYIDLCNADWQAIEVDFSGWRVIQSPPVRFRRTTGMLPLPMPRAGGSINKLRSFLNVKNDIDWVLAVAWVLAALRNIGPYPLLAISGEQGSAKSTFCALLRMIVDPNTTPLRGLPREDRDMFLNASNSHVLAFDNLSNMPVWISDTLCRLSTGGGFSTRSLYTDDEEKLFNAKRPIILNGIEDVAIRPDLADRSLITILEPIPEDKRRGETELFESYAQVLPDILGAFLDAVAHGLKMLPLTKLDRLPRMADFAIWATACEGALWETGTFMAAYESSRRDAIDDVIDANPVASAVRLFMDGRTIWTGTATELLKALDEKVSDAVRSPKEWPKLPNALSGKLRRAATFLRKIGIDVNQGERGKERKRNRLITISKTPDSGGDPSSAPSRPPEQQEFFDIPVDDVWTQNPNTDDGAIATVNNTAGKINDCDGADDLDDEITRLSGFDDIGV